MCDIISSGANNSTLDLAGRSKWCAGSGCDGNIVVSSVTGTKVDWSAYINVPCLWAVLGELSFGVSSEVWGGLWGRR